VDRDKVQALLSLAEQYVTEASTIIQRQEHLIRDLHRRPDETKAAEPLGRNLPGCTPCHGEASAKHGAAATQSGYGQRVIADDPQLRLIERVLPGAVAARPSRITHPLLKLHFGLVAAAGHATARSVTNYVHSNCRCIR
jgi:hypothetical protein